MVIFETDISVLFKFVKLMNDELLQLMDDELLPLLPGVLETAIAPERSGRRQSHTTKTVIKTIPRKRTIPKKAGALFRIKIRFGAPLKI